MELSAGLAVRFGDHRTWSLPNGWEPVDQNLLETAHVRAMAALEFPLTLDRLSRYYDPAGRYAGATFAGLTPNHDFEITATDLWALSTLSIKVPPLHGRQLIGPSPLADTVRRSLHRLPTTLLLSEIDATTFSVMWELQDAIRSGLPPLGDNEKTNQWVLAAKLCARKRPELFPVRDHVVCKYLAREHKLGPQPGRLGQFGRDIPVFAHLISSPPVLEALKGLRHELYALHPHCILDWGDLRLLDAVLWLHGQETKQATTPSMPI